MSISICLLPNALSDLFVQVSCSGNITRADRYGLMAALLADSLNEQERESIDRLLGGVRRRRLQVIDEVSSVCVLKPLK